MALKHILSNSLTGKNNTELDFAAETSVSVSTCLEKKSVLPFSVILFSTVMAAAAVVDAELRSHVALIRELSLV